LEQSSVIRKLGEYVIRRAEVEDIPKVITVNLLTLPEHYTDFFYHDLLRGFPEGFLVAERDDEIVGYIMCRLEFGFSNLGINIVRKGHIVSVAVMPEHRKRGLGRALLEEAMKAMKDKGCKEVFLEVRVSNLPAITLYEKMGYMEVRKIPYYYRDGETALVMARPL
jgi:ribosomal-protein-alanine N-acetyltransferase